MPTTRSRPMPPETLFGLLLALVGALYGFTLFAPPIYDDVPYIADNPLFLLPFPEFFRRLLSPSYFFFTREATFQPLVTAFHYFTHAQPIAYRLAGLLLHVLNAGLVYRLALSLLEDPRQAALTAVLFSVFPAHTETINISSYKGHLLASGFVLLSVLAWLGTLRTRRRMPPFWLHASFLAALASKETGIIAAPLIAAHWLCFRPLKLPVFLRKTGGLAALAASYLGFRFLWLRQPPPNTYFYAGTSRAAAALSAAGGYLRTLLVPSPLCLQRSPGPAMLWPAALCAAYAAGLWRARRSPRIAFPLLWIGLALLPFHSVPSTAYNPQADRYLYLSSVGFCLLAAQLLSGRARWVPYGLCVAWVALTASRNALYLEPGLLFRQTVSCAPLNPHSYSLLGEFQLNVLGDCPQALESYEKARALDPRLNLFFADSGFHHFVGVDYMIAWINYRMKRYPEAEKIFSGLLPSERDPRGKAALLEKLGDVYRDQGRDNDALSRYLAASDLFPDWYLPYAHAGALLIKRDPPRAAAFLRRAVAALPAGGLPPGLPGDMNLLLGEALLAGGNEDEALTLWGRALEKEPSRRDLMSSLGNLRARRGEAASAAAYYRRIISLVESEEGRLRPLLSSPEARARGIPELLEKLGAEKTAAEKALLPLAKKPLPG